MTPKSLNNQSHTKPIVWIGIDPGTSTGVALWNKDEKEFTLITTVKIHQAFKIIESSAESYTVNVRVEDARQRKFFGKSGPEKWQGAGSIKRDSTIWQHYLEDAKKAWVINDFQITPPIQGATKFSADQFQRLTGWTQRTSEHARDAALLVFNY